MSQKKIEQQFYSKKNFQLILQVISESIPKDKLPQNLQQGILNSMDYIFKNSNLPTKILKKSDRKTIVQSLNKSVISHILQSIRRINIPKQTTSISELRKRQNTYQNNPDEVIINQDNYHDRPMPSLHPKVKTTEFPRPQAMDPRSFQDPKEAIDSMKQTRNNLFKTEKPDIPDFTLPKAQAENLPDPKEKFEEMLRQRDIEEQQISNGELSMTMEKIQSQTDGDFHKAFTKDSWLEGLDSSLLDIENIVDTPDTDNDLSKMAQPYKNGNNISVNLPEYEERNPVSAFSDENRRIPLSSIKLNNKFLTLSSLTQTPNIQFSSDHIYITVHTDINNIEKTDNRGVLLYKTQEERISKILTELYNSVTVCCSDVSIPNSVNDALEEPFLWLHIDGWGHICRLRPVSSHPMSKFLTLKPAETRKIPIRGFPEQLDIQLLRPTGYPVHFNQKPIKITNIENNKGYVSICCNNSLKKGDVVYLYRMFKDSENLIELLPSVRFSNARLKKVKDTQRLSFNIHTVNEDDEEYLSDNRISKKRNNTKVSPDMGDFLSKGDLVYIQSESGIHWCEVYSTGIGVLVLNTDINKIPSKIVRFGFLNRLLNGINSSNSSDIHFAGGFRIRGKNDKNLVLDIKYENMNIGVGVKDEFYLLSRCSQVMVTLQMETLD